MRPSAWAGSEETPRLRVRERARDLGRCCSWRAGRLVSSRRPDQPSCAGVRGLAALSSYAGGIVDRVVRLSNGEYEVHQIGVNWPHHIFVTSDFKWSARTERAPGRLGWSGAGRELSAAGPPVGRSRAALSNGRLVARSTCGTSQASGSAISKREPSPGREVTMAPPRWASPIVLTIASPRPLPWVRGAVSPDGGTTSTRRRLTIRETTCPDGRRRPRNSPDPAG